jgi:hypothetical protein
MPRQASHDPREMTVEQINDTTGTVLYLQHDQQDSTRLLTGAPRLMPTAPYSDADDSPLTQQDPLGLLSWSDVGQSSRLCRRSSKQLYMLVYKPMSHAHEVGHSHRVQPREVVRDDDTARIYRRPAEKWAMPVGGGLIFAPVTIKLVGFLAKHTNRLSHALLPTVLLIFVYLAIPVGYFVWNRRVGVEVSANGVKNVAFTHISVTEWKDIEKFIVDRYTPLSASVLAVHRDGSRTPLNALARWVWWKDALDPYRDALNGELEAAQARSPSSA